MRMQALGDQVQLSFQQITDSLRALDTYYDATGHLSSELLSNLLDAGMALVDWETKYRAGKKAKEEEVAGTAESERQS